MGEAREALGAVLSSQSNEKQVLLVLANKRDLSDAMSKEEIAERLGVDTMTERSWRTYACDLILYEFYTSSSFIDHCFSPFANPVLKLTLFHCAGIQPCCGVNGDGLYEGLDWIYWKIVG